MRLSVILGCLLFCIAGGSPAEDIILLRAADTFPASYPTTQGLYRMKSYLEEKTDGRIQMIVYPDGELGSEYETIEMTMIEALDIARVSAAILANFSRPMEMLSIPYLFGTEEQMWTVLRGEIGQQLLDYLPEQDLIGLCFYESGSRGFYSLDKPIYRPEDLQTLRIGSARAPVIEDTIQSLGAIPTRMDFSEVDSALQLGVIDGAEGNLLAYYTAGHYRQAKYYTFDEHSRVPDVIIMSRGAWRKLSAYDQRLVQLAAQESVEYEQKLWYEQEEKAREALEEMGVKLIYPKRDLELLFLESTAPVFKKYRKRHPLIRFVPTGG